MRIHKEKFFDRHYRSGWCSSYDRVKEEGWNEFLDLFKKYQKSFPSYVWKINDTEGVWPNERKTSFVGIKPMSFQEAYRYYENNLGKECKRHAEFERSQNSGYLEGGALDFVIDRVLGNMIKYNLKKHRINALSHIDDSVFVGTQSGNLIQTTDNADIKDNFNGRSYMDYDSLGSNSDWHYNFFPHYKYPKGVSQGRVIHSFSRPINAMITIPQEIYENTGIKQRVLEGIRRRAYFASGGRKSGDVPFRKVA